MIDHTIHHMPCVTLTTIPFNITLLFTRYFHSIMSETPIVGFK